MTTTSSRLFPLVPILLLLGAAVYAGLAYMERQESRDEWLAQRDEIEALEAILLQHPDLASGQSAVTPDLKRLAQEASARSSVPVVYLNQSQKSVGEGVRETNVVIRSIQVPHARWVRFLTELENRGGGAKVKEIRVKPAPERSDSYSEAEAVFSVRTMTGESR